MYRSSTALIRRRIASCREHGGLQVLTIRRTCAFQWNEAKGLPGEMNTIGVSKVRRGGHKRNNMISEVGENLTRYRSH